MEFLREMGLNWSEIADSVMVSRVTLWRHLKDLGLSTVGYTDISDSDLDSVVTSLVRDYPNSGVILIRGHLKS